MRLPFRLAALAASAIPFILPVTAEKQRPNIVYIMADDLGYGELGCYGQERIKTPHIDRIAREGIKFTDHYAGFTVCAPSRCVLMTGLHSGHCVIRGNYEIQPEGQYPLPKDTVTVGHLMQDAGYATGAFGKWGLGAPESVGVPHKQGFDRFYGYLCQRQAHTYYPKHLWDNEKKVPLDGKTYSHTLIADEGLKFIRENKDRPFFLYLPYTIPHAALHVPSIEPYENEDWPLNMKKLAAMITLMDHDVGRTLDLLKELGLDERTLVIFTSDNGPHKEGGADPNYFKSSGPFKGYKRSFHDGGIRVPLVARWPGKITPGTVTDHICGHQDLMPTACDLAGATTPKGIDGISFLPTLLGKTAEQKQHKYLYWDGGGRAIRMGKWKALRRSKSSMRLYDMTKDPGETTDISGAYPEVVTTLHKYFEEAHTESEYWNSRPRSKPKPIKTGKILSKTEALPRKGWKVSVSSEHGPRPRKNALDGNPATHYHSAYAPKVIPYPHTFEIDLGKEQQVHGFQYQPRQASPQNGRIKDYEFFVSRDGKDWGKSVASGSFPDNADEQQVKFDARPARYVRLIGKKGHSDSFAVIAEFNVLGSQ
jgi:arylsulfatase A